jgi:hypothetical protein
MLLRLVTVGARHEVTAALVKRLWADASDGTAPTDDVHSRAETLQNRVNAESPLVNRGLTSLHHLTRSPDQSRDDLMQARTAWLAEVRLYEVDPSAWMRQYFQDLVRSFTQHHGLEMVRPSRPSLFEMATCTSWMCWPKYESNAINSARQRALSAA